MAQYNFQNIPNTFSPEIGQVHVPGLRAERFRQMLNRVGQDAEVWRGIPHVITFIPVGNVTNTSEYLYRANLYPAEEINFPSIDNIWQLKGYITATGETTQFVPNFVTVQQGSFSIINPQNPSQVFVENVDYIVDYNQGQLSLTPSTSIPLLTTLQASYFVQEPCVDPYTMSARPECPYDNGTGIVYTNGAGTMDRDTKTMLFTFNGTITNSRDNSVLGVSRSSVGTGYIPIFTTPSVEVTGFESNPVLPQVVSEGPGIMLFSGNTPRFSQYSINSPAMFVVENAEDNLILYSSFEEGPLGSAIVGWTSTNLVATYDNTYFIDGAQSVLLDTTSSTNIINNTPGLLTQQITLNPGTYFFYAHVRTQDPDVIEMQYPIYNAQVSAGAGEIPFFLYVAQDLISAPIATNYVRLPFDEEGWFRIETSFTIPPGPSMTLNLGVWLDVGNQVWVDAVQLQDRNNYATSYIQTSASPESRSADVISPYPFLGNMTIYKGGISMRIRPNWISSALSPTDQRFILQWGTTNEYIWVYYLNGNLTLEISTINDSGNQFISKCSLPWNIQQEETTYVISALWDNTTGLYVGINDQWAENAFFGFPWKPKNYPATFQLLSNGTTNFDGWVSDVVGWGAMVVPQDALTTMLTKIPLQFETDFRIRVILETPKFKSEWTSAGYFQEGDLYATFPADFKFSSDNIGALETNGMSQKILFRTKIRIRGYDYRVMNQPETIYAENEVVGSKVLLRLIQTSDDNRV